MQFAGHCPFPSSLLDAPLESSPLCHSSRALKNLLWGAILIHLCKSWKFRNPAQRKIPNSQVSMSAFTVQSYNRNRLSSSTLFQALRKTGTLYLKGRCIERKLPPARHLKSPAWPGPWKNMTVCKIERSKQWRSLFKLWALWRFSPCFEAEIVSGFSRPTFRSFSVPRQPKSHEFHGALLELKAPMLIDFTSWKLTGKSLSKSLKWRSLQPHFKQEEMRQLNKDGGFWSISVACA